MVRVLIMRYLLALLLVAAAGASSSATILPLGSGPATSSVLTNMSTSSVAGNTTATTLGVAVGGSSVTLTTSGGKVLVWFSGTMDNSIDQGLCSLAILQDGAYVENNSETKASHGMRGSVGNGAQDVSFVWVTPTAPSSGSHTWSITMAVGSGTCSIPANDTVAAPDPNGTAQIGVLELK